MLFDGSYGVLSWLYNIIVFILGSYTYAWLSDYILTFKENIILRYFFMKSVIFRKDFGAIVKEGYSNTREFAPVYNFKNKRIEEAHEVYLKRTFISIIINIIAKFILAWMFVFVFWISIFIHPITIRKYKEKLQILHVEEN